jgi:hypothetical protein
MIFLIGPRQSARQTESEKLRLMEVSLVSNWLILSWTQPQGLSQGLAFST